MNTSKKICSAVFLIVFFTAGVFAQSKGEVRYRVKGTVTETGTGQEVPYATVGIENDSSGIVTRMASDVKGRFEAELPGPGNYVVVISSVGFATVPQDFTIRPEERQKDLGKIEIKEGVALSEVTVAAQKPLVKSDIDKITYSIESDPESETNNVLEMLRKVPLITVDAEENISLNGQTNFKVLMNGKSSTLLSGNLKDVLKSIPASTIKDIEVITNPSSKYDAEGIGGIINIITTKKGISGVMGSVGLNADIWGGFGGNVFVSSQVNKFGISGRYFANRFTRPAMKSESFRENRISDEFKYTDSRGKSRWQGFSQSLSLEASYEADTFNLITFSMWGYIGHNRSKSDMRTEEWNTDREITRAFSNRMSSRGKYGSVSGNLDYQRTFMKPDKTFTLSYKFDYNPDNSDSRNEIAGILNYAGYRQRSKNDAKGIEHTIQADYYDPLTEMHQIEGGVKYILRKNIGDSETLRLMEETAGWESVPVGDLDYTQHILGLYGGYVLKLKKYSTKAGFRIESTWNDGLSRQTDQPDLRFTNNLFNVIPYLTLSYQVKESQNIKVSYTQRLSRPGIWYLNPYVDTTDPLNISYGNPSLKSEVSHSISADYSLFAEKYDFTAGLGSYFLNNGIESISKVDAAGVRSTTYENIGKRRDFYLSLYGSARFTPKLNIYTNMSGNYTRISSSRNGELKNSGFRYNGSLGIRWVLWKDGSINGNFGLYTPYVMLQGKSSLFYYTGFGVSQQLLDKKMTLSLSVSDPFWKYKKYTSRYDDPENFRMESIYRQRGQTVRFSISYNFGQMSGGVKKAKRGITNDDVKGGDNQQGGSSQ